MTIFLSTNARNRYNGNMNFEIIEEMMSSDERRMITVPAGQDPSSITIKISRKAAHDFRELMKEMDTTAEEFLKTALARYLHKTEEEREFATLQTAFERPTPHLG